MVEEEDIVAPCEDEKEKEDRDGQKAVVAEGKPVSVAERTRTGKLIFVPHEDPRAQAAAGAACCGRRISRRQSGY